MSRHPTTLYREAMSHYETPRNSYEETSEAEGSAWSVERDGPNSQQLEISHNQTRISLQSKYP